MSFEPSAIRQSLLSGLQELEPFASQSEAERAALADATTLYLGELAKWNKAYNLTAIRDPDEMVSLHILDSLSVLPELVGTHILDAGTGAGLPGIPLALCCPERHFTLLDSNGKKVRFVEHVSALLRLDNVDVVQSRLESYEPEQPVDQIISRAFTSLAEFVRRSEDLLQPGGCLLAMKGKRPESELAELPAGWTVVDIRAATVPGVAGERHFISIERQ